jgi:hypothetical protein
MKKCIFFLGVFSSFLVTTSFAQSWSLTGNSATTAGTNFLGTKDGKAVVFKTNNTERMRILPAGNVGIGVTTPVQRLDVNGNINLGKGFSLFMENQRVLRVDLANTSVFLGNSAGAKNTGLSNTATGSYALSSTNSGSNNSAFGYTALNSNTTGYSNTAIGTFALSLNTTANLNTAIGHYALYQNSTGSSNTATGYSALYSNTTGEQNVATGQGAMATNIDGSRNTAIGSEAMNESGSSATENAAVGYRALLNNSGHHNVAMGTYALTYNNGAQYNVALGYYAGGTFLHGWNNTFIGADADATANNLYNTVALGNYAKVTASNQVRIGNSSTTSIGGYANWTNISDGRVKKNIKENVPGLAFINKLKPVTYNLDLDAADKIMAVPAAKDKDGKLLTKQVSQADIAARQAKQQVVYTGFVAQDVEKAAKGLNYDFSGVDAAKSDKDLYGLRYNDFIMPLVKAVQELSKENDELKSRLEKLEAAMNTRQSNVTSAQSSQIATISSASVEQNKPNPFNRSTTINYTLPQQFSSAKIVITDKSGNTLKEIKVSGATKGGVNVDASTLSSGTYQYSFYVDGKLISSKQMVLIK